MAESRHCLKICLFYFVNMMNHCIARKSYFYKLISWDRVFVLFCFVFRREHNREFFCLFLFLSATYISTQHEAIKLWRGRRIQYANSERVENWGKTCTFDTYHTDSLHWRWLICWKLCAIETLLYSVLDITCSLSAGSLTGVTAPKECLLLTISFLVLA